ncbi:hypothetical protein DSO57_1034462 [Entomophthora muscae]|uniref:Uncharacterized protein n=1 Tax=Entomophthora muscae TaxID=34485 RepID=A0ACC2U8V1_9FUNG|nr:hypothetical protein DSO57_1034462 [Entomophthora muscae]
MLPAWPNGFNGAGGAQIAMSGFITIRDTNKQLSSGVIPSSLDHGFIPCADKINECIKQQRSPGLSNQAQADKLLEEILKTNSEAQEGGQLYVIDDYDEWSDDPEERSMSKSPSRPQAELSPCPRQGA